MLSEAKTCIFRNLHTVSCYLLLQFNTVGPRHVSNILLQATFNIKNGWPSLAVTHRNNKKTQEFSQSLPEELFYLALKITNVHHVAMPTIH